MRFNGGGDIAAIFVVKDKEECDAEPIVLNITKRVDEKSFDCESPITLFLFRMYQEGKQPSNQLSLIKAVVIKI